MGVVPAMQDVACKSALVPMRSLANDYIVQ